MPMDPPLNTPSYSLYDLIDIKNIDRIISASKAEDDKLIFIRSYLSSVSSEQNQLVPTQSDTDTISSKKKRKSDQEESHSKRVKSNYKETDSLKEAPQDEQDTPEETLESRLLKGSAAFAKVDDTKNKLVPSEVLNYDSLVRSYYRFFPLDMSSFVGIDDISKFISLIPLIEPCQEIENHDEALVRKESKRIYTVSERSKLQDSESTYESSPSPPVSNYTPRVSEKISIEKESIDEGIELTAKEIEKLRDDIKEQLSTPLTQQGIGMLVREVEQYGYSYKLFDEMTKSKWLKPFISARFPTGAISLSKFVKEGRFDSAHDPEIPLKELSLIHI